MDRSSVRMALFSLLVFFGMSARAPGQSPADSTGTIAIVAIEGIEDAAGYAAVTTWLESAVTPQALSVEEVQEEDHGATVVYRIRGRGDPQQVAGVLGAYPQLRPLPATNPASLRYRYSP